MAKLPESRGSMSDTAELVGRAREGDQAAFATLYDRHARLIRAICFDATAHLASAEDLAQDVFLRAYQKLGQLRDDERFMPWLCEIARRAGHDWRRSARRDGKHLTTAQQVDRATPQEAPQIDELRDAIGRLPEEERMALHLFYLEEQSAVVARQVLGLSQSGFYKLLDRARNRVGSIMRRNEGAIR
jgi:RNA polymerase sigma-70 factor (ECF subfamily)